MSPVIRRCGGTGRCEVDPLDIVEMIREGLLVLDPDLTVRFANRSCGNTFTVTPEDTPRAKEGLQ